MPAYRSGPSAPYVPVRVTQPAELLPVDTSAVEATQNPQVGLPRALAALAWTHRARLMPFTWMTAADVTALSIHYGYAAPGLLSLACIKAVGTTLAASFIAAAWAAWRTREGRLGQRVKLLKTRRKIRNDVKRAVAAGSLWSMTAVLWTPVGPHGSMQIALLAGGVAVSAKHLYRTRQQTPVEQMQEIEPPREDHRLALFRSEFCQAGPLEWAELDLDTITGGFRIHVEISRASKGTYRDVQALTEHIARSYDVPFNQVTVETTESQSPRHAVVTVLTEARAYEREQQWDGESTYDPRTGAFDLGRFPDGSPSHWQIHKPYNGACCGIAVGVRGSGKTATLHVVACETGQAKLCVECGADASCVTCRLARICGVWMGDPQRQGFALWKRRADLTAWGPLSCIRMLAWGFAAMRARSAAMGDMQWTDHLGRDLEGRGWFDPTPAFPQLVITIDEWPMLAKDPVLGPWAIYFAERIGDESRKVGVSLNLGSQEGDVDILGTRGLRNALIADNAIGHRSDRLTKQMLELDGNPADVPVRAVGAGYLRGFDQRSDAMQRTKTLREVLRPGETGADVVAIAERIAADPIGYDEAVLGAIVPLGYTGPGQVLDDDKDGWTLDMLEEAETSSEPAAAADVPAQPVKHAVPVSPHDLSAVWRACEAGPTEIYDVMVHTGLDALTANRCVDRLIDDGHLRQNPDGAYAPASLTP